MLWLPLLLAACGGKGDDDRPLDGGHPLGEPIGSFSVKDLANQDCFRAERGRWHYSIGHCEAMLPAREMEGVWVTAFEESSFFPGPARMPAPNDPTRYATGIELDGERVLRAAGHKPEGAHGDALWLRFVGRRTRDPYHVDCFGTPYWVFVVDRLLEARFLGEMKPARWPTPEEARRRPPTVAVRHKGRWGEEEAKAVEHCSFRGSKADRLEDVDQVPSHSSPPGRSSAE
jgi:hypothetical protein